MGEFLGEKRVIIIDAMFSVSPFLPTIFIWRMWLVKWRLLEPILNVCMWLNFFNDFCNFLLKAITVVDTRRLLIESMRSTYSNHISITTTERKVSRITKTRIWVIFAIFWVPPHTVTTTFLVKCFISVLILGMIASKSVLRLRETNTL